MRINVTRSSLPDFEEYCQEIRDLWNSHWLTNNGEKHNRLQGALCDYLHAPHVELFTNGHLSLEAVLKALKLQGEVITTPFTFASTTHAIVRCGLTPVFCDVKSDGTLDADLLEGLITEKTCAIVPVHVYGHLCDVDKIQQVADAHGLPVIYDAAHAFGVVRNGVPAAAFGLASMYSFHATKVFHTIEGGAIATQSDALAEALRLERNFGITGPEDVVSVGGNAKMNEFAAAMGLCNLRHLEEEIAKRKTAVMQYRKRLSGVEGIYLIPSQKGVVSNYAYFPAVFEGYKQNRVEVFLKLQENGITARKYFAPLTSDFSCYKDLEKGETPVAKAVAENVLCLPLYADLSIEDVNRICDIILG